MNSRPSTVAVLKDFAPHLGDIHGQHDQQLLFDPAAQLAMLDAFGKHRELRAKVRDLFGVWKRLTTEISALEGSEQEKARLLDLWQFQKREIENASLRSGEDAELEAERRVQQNAGKLLETAGSAYEALYEAPESAWTTARAVAKKLDELARIDPVMEPVRQALEPALIAMQDVLCGPCATIWDAWKPNPRNVPEEINLRLAAIDKFKRKYGGGVDEIIAFFEDVSRN